MKISFLTTINQEALNSLNTTNYRSVVMVRCAVAALFFMGVAYFHAMYVGDAPHHQIAMQVQDAALYFLAVALGLNTAQYTAKRMTDHDLAAIKKTGSKTSGAEAKDIAQASATKERESISRRDETEGVEPTYE